MKNSKGFTGIEFIIGLAILVVVTTVCLVGKHVKETRESTEQRLEDVIERLEDAKEERHLYRDLSMMLYVTQTKVSEEKAYHDVDQWLKDNRDCVNIEFGYEKVKGNKIKIELGK